MTDALSQSEMVGIRKPLRHQQMFLCIDLFLGPSVELTTPAPANRGISVGMISREGVTWLRPGAILRAKKSTVAAPRAAVSGQDTFAIKINKKTPVVQKAAHDVDTQLDGR